MLTVPAPTFDYIGRRGQVTYFTFFCKGEPFGDTGCGQLVRFEFPPNSKLNARRQDGPHTPRVHTDVTSSFHYERCQQRRSIKHVGPRTQTARLFSERPSVHVSPSPGEYSTGSRSNLSAQFTKHR